MQKQGECMCVYDKDSEQEKVYYCILVLLELLLITSRLNAMYVIRTIIGLKLQYFDKSVS